MRARNPSSARDTYRERPEAFRRERDDGVPSWTPRSWGGGSQRSQRSGGDGGGGGPEGGRGGWEAFKARFWRSNGGDAAPRAEAARAPPLRHPLEQWSLRQQHELKKRGYADEDFSPYRYTPEGRGHAQN
jgi:hypothetical protein